MQKRMYWHKLDNAAKLFPAISKNDRSNVFRLSFYMFEDVVVNALEEAVNISLNRFQVFKTQLKNGVFWNYFAENDKRFVVEKENPKICSYFKFNKNNGYMFKIYYFNNKIMLETFHALSDGFGALQFLKSIVYKYLQIMGYNFKHENLILGEMPFSNRENEDSFVNNYDATNKQALKEEKAYHLKGDTFNDDWSLYLKVSLNTKEFINMIKTKYNVTVTQYLTALIAYSILDEGVDVNSSKKPVKMFVPVNLRPYFDSDTLRNFSLYIKASYKTGRNLSFKEILLETKTMFEKQLTKDDLSKRLSALVSLEKNIFVRFVPLFIKNFIFKIAYQMLGESIITSSISNIGIANLPKEMMKYVTDVEFTNSGRGINCGVITYNETTNIVFNSAIKDISVIRSFIYQLRNDGIDITLDTNYREEYDEIL